MDLGQLEKHLCLSEAAYCWHGDKNSTSWGGTPMPALRRVQRYLETLPKDTLLTDLPNRKDRAMEDVAAAPKFESYKQFFTTVGLP